MNTKSQPQPARCKFSILKQICNLIPPHLVPKIARETGVDKKARAFSPWSHIVKGDGVAQDYEEAAKWFRNSAEQGYAMAQYHIGVKYANGRGVTRDYIEAHKWFRLAAVGGQEEGSKNQDIIAKKMTPEQIAEAQKLAREWKPKKAASK